MEYFKKSEGNRNENFIKYKKGKYHNDNGAQIIDSVGELNVHFKTFVAAGIERGVKYLDDIKADEYIGYTTSQSFTSNGRRQSTAKSYLIPANRSNLHIVKYAHVQKILIDQNYSVTIQKEVILSAGADSSPQILMLSGIGPEQHLKQKNQ